VTAVAVGRLLRSLLAGVSASDPSTLVLVGLTLVAVSLAACYMPARRASRVNPIAALRMD
jgi:ABC-type lipoprotein release transport system permease subunit